MKRAPGLISFFDDEEIFDPKDSGKPEATVPWVKYRCIEDIHTIDNDRYLVFGSEIHITFYDVETGSSIVYQANTVEKGFGVKCIACHPKYNVFAYAEKRISPLIYIREFPSFEGVITLPKVHIKCRYARQCTGPIVNIAFTETRHLISVSRAPDCQIIVWDWWTGAKLSTASHGIDEFFLQVSCTYTNPVHVAIASKARSDCIIYVIHLIRRQCYISDVRIAIKFDAVFNDISLSPTGTLYGIDEECRVHCYPIHTVGGRQGKIIKSEKMQRRRPKKQGRNFITWTSGGVIAACCDGSLLSYDTDTFDEKWKYLDDSLPSYTAFVVSYSKKYCFGMNIRGELVHFTLLDDGKPKLENRLKIGNLIKDFTPLNPSGRLIATLNAFNELAVWKKTSGTAIAYFHVKNSNVIAAHPLLPRLAVGRKDGKITFIDCEMPFRPVVYLDLDLTDRAIEHIEYEFTEASVVHIFVLSHSRHFMFLLKELPENEVMILDLLVFKLPIIDFTAFICQSSHKPFVYVLIRDEIEDTAAKRMDVFTTNIEEKFFHLEVFDLLEPMTSINMNRFEMKLILTSNEAHSYFLYDIRKDEVDNDQGVKSSHRTPGFIVFSGCLLGKERLISYGCDGSLFIDLELDFNVHPHDETCSLQFPHRSQYCLQTGPEGDHLCMHSHFRVPRVMSNVKDEEEESEKASIYTLSKSREAVCLHQGFDKLDSYFMPHHWVDRGIKKVMIDPMKYCVYSLGYSGNLVCTVIGNIPTALWEEQNAIQWHENESEPFFWSPKRALHVVATRHVSLLPEPSYIDTKSILKGLVPVTILYEAIIPDVYAQISDDAKEMIRALSLPEVIPEDEEKDEEKVEKKPTEQEVVPSTRLSFFYELAIPVEQPSLEESTEDKETEMKRVAVIYETYVQNALPQEQVLPALLPAIEDDEPTPMHDIDEDEFLQRPDSEKGEESNPTVAIVYETTLPNVPDVEGSQSVTITEEKQKRDRTERTVTFVYETDQDTAAELLQIFKALQPTTTTEVETSQGGEGGSEEHVQALSENVEIATGIAEELKTAVLGKISESNEYVSEDQTATTEVETSQGGEGGSEEHVQALSENVEIATEIAEELKKTVLGKISESNGYVSEDQTATTEVETSQGGEGGSEEHVQALSENVEIATEIAEELKKTVLGKISESNGYVSEDQTATMEVETSQGGEGGSEEHVQALSENVENATEIAEELKTTVLGQISESYEYVWDDHTATMEVETSQGGEGGSEEHVQALSENVENATEIAEELKTTVLGQISESYEYVWDDHTGSNLSLSPESEYPEEEMIEEPEVPLHRSREEDGDFIENKCQRMYIFNRPVLNVIFRKFVTKNPPKKPTSTIGLRVSEDDIEAVNLYYEPSEAKGIVEKEVEEEEEREEEEEVEDEEYDEYVREEEGEEMWKELEEDVKKKVKKEEEVDDEEVVEDELVEEEEEEEFLISPTESEDELDEDRKVTIVYETIIPEIFEEPGNHSAMKGYPLRRWITPTTALELLRQMYPKFSERVIKKMAERLLLVDPDMVPHLGDIWKKVHSIPSGYSMFSIDCNLSQISITKGLDDPRTLCQRMAIINGSFTPTLMEMLGKNENKKQPRKVDPIVEHLGIVCWDDYYRQMDIEIEDVDTFTNRTSMMSVHDRFTDLDDLGRKVTVVYETTIPFEQMKQHMDRELLQLLAGRESMIPNKRKAFEEDKILQQIIHTVDTNEYQPVPSRCARVRTQMAERAQRRFEIGTEMYQYIIRTKTEKYKERKKFKMVTVDEKLVTRILQVLHNNAVELEGLTECDYSDTALHGVSDRKGILILPRIMMVLDKVLRDLRRNPEENPGIEGSGEIAIVENNLIPKIFDDLLGTELKMLRLAVAQERPSSSELLTRSHEAAVVAHQRWLKWMNVDEALRNAKELYLMGSDIDFWSTQGKEKKKNYLILFYSKGVWPDSPTMVAMEFSDTEYTGPMRCVHLDLRTAILQPWEEFAQQMFLTDISSDIVVMAASEEEFPERKEDVEVLEEWHVEENLEDLEKLGEKYDIPKIIPKILRKMRTEASEWANLVGCIGVVSQLDDSRLIWKWIQADDSYISQEDEPWKTSGLMAAMIDRPVMPRILSELYFEAESATNVEPEDIVKGGMELANIIRYRKLQGIPFTAELGCDLMPRIFRELLDFTKISRGESALSAEDDDYEEIKDEIILRIPRMGHRIDKFPSPWMKKVLGKNITQRTLQILDLGFKRYEELSHLRPYQSRRTAVYPEMNELTIAMLQTMQDFHLLGVRSTPRRMPYQRSKSVLEIFEEQMEGFSPFRGRRTASGTYQPSKSFAELLEEQVEGKPPERLGFSSIRGEQLTPYKYLNTMFDTEVLKEQEEGKGGARRSYAPGRGHQEIPYPNFFKLMAALLQNIDEAENIRERQQLDADMRGMDGEEWNRTTYAVNAPFIPDVLQNLSNYSREEGGSAEGEEEMVTTAQSIINGILGSLNEERDPHSQAMDDEVIHMLSGIMYELMSKVEKSKVDLSASSKMLSQIAVGDSRASLGAYREESGVSRRMLVSGESIISAVQRMLKGDEGKHEEELDELLSREITEIPAGAARMMIVIDDQIIARIIQVITNETDIGGLSVTTIGSGTSATAKISSTIFPRMEMEEGSRTSTTSQISSTIFPIMRIEEGSRISTTPQISSTLFSRVGIEEERSVQDLSQESSSRFPMIPDSIPEEQDLERSVQDLSQESSSRFPMIPDSIPEEQDLEQGKIHEGKKKKTKKAVQFQDELQTRSSEEFHGFRRLSRKRASIVEDSVIPQILELLAKEATVEFTAEEAKQIFEGSDEGDEGLLINQLGTHYWERRRLYLSEELPPHIFQLLEDIVMSGRIPEFYTDIMETINSKERAVGMQIAHGAVSKVFDTLSSTEDITDEDQARIERRLSSIETARDVLKEMLQKFVDTDEEGAVSRGTSSVQVVRGIVSDVLQGFQGKSKEDIKKKIRWDLKEQAIAEEIEDLVRGLLPTSSMFDSPSRLAYLLESIGHTTRGTKVAVIKEKGIPEVLEKLSVDAWKRTSRSLMDVLQQTFEIPVTNIQESDARATSVQGVVIPAIHQELSRLCEGETVTDNERSSKSKGEKKVRSMAIVNDNFIPIFLEMLSNAVQGEGYDKFTDQELKPLSSEELPKITSSSIQHYCDKAGRKMFIFDSTLLPTLLDMSKSEGWRSPSATAGIIRGLEDQDKETLASKSQIMIIFCDSILTSLLDELNSPAVSRDKQKYLTDTYEGFIPTSSEMELSPTASRERIFEELSDRAILEGKDGKLTLIYETMFPRIFLSLLNELPLQIDKSTGTKHEEIPEYEIKSLLAESTVHRSILIKLVQMFENVGADIYTGPVVREGPDVLSYAALVRRKNMFVNDALIDFLLRGLMELVGDEFHSEVLIEDRDEVEIHEETSEDSSSSIEEDSTADREDDDDDVDLFIDFDYYYDPQDLLCVHLRDNDEDVQVDINEEVYISIGRDHGDEIELQDQQDQSDESDSEGSSGILLIDRRGVLGSRAFGDRDKGSSTTSITEFEGDDVRIKRRNILFSAIVSEQTQGLSSMYEGVERKNQSIINDPVVKLEFLRILTIIADTMSENKGQEKAVLEDIILSYRILRALTDISGIQVGHPGSMERKDAIINDHTLKLKIIRALSEISQADVQKRGKRDGIADECVLKAHISLAMPNDILDSIILNRKRFAHRALSRIKKSNSWPIIDPEGVKTLRNNIVGDPSSRFQERSEETNEGRVMQEYRLGSSKLSTFNALEDNINTQQGFSIPHSNDKTLLFPHSDDFFFHSKTISKIPIHPSLNPERAKEYVRVYSPSIVICSDPGDAGSKAVSSRTSVWGKFRDLKRHSDRLSQTQSSASHPPEVHGRVGGLDERSSFKLRLKEESMMRSRREHKFPPIIHQRSKSWPRIKREMRREQIPEFERDPAILSEMVLRLFCTSEIVDGKSYSEIGKSFQGFGMGGQTDLKIDDVYALKKELDIKKRKCKRSKYETVNEIFASIRKLLTISIENKLSGQKRRAISEDPILTSRILRAIQRVSEGHSSVKNSNNVFEILISKILGEDSSMDEYYTLDPFLVSQMVQQLVECSMEVNTVSPQISEDFTGMEKIQHTVVEDPILRPRILRSLSMMFEEDQEVRQRKDNIVGELLERTNIFLDTLEISGKRDGEKERTGVVVHDPILRSMILLALAKREGERFSLKGARGRKETIDNDPVLRTNILLTLLKQSDKQGQIKISGKATVDDLLLRTKMLNSLSKLSGEILEKEKRGGILVEDTVLRAMIAVALSELPPDKLQEHKLWDTITDNTAPRSSTLPHGTQLDEDITNSDADRLPEKGLLSFDPEKGLIIFPDDYGRKEQSDGTQLNEDITHSDADRLSEKGLLSFDPEKGLIIFPDDYGRKEQSEEISGDWSESTRILQGLYRMSEGLQKRERKDANVYDPDLGISILLFLSELLEQPRRRVGKRSSTIIDDPQIRTRILLALSKLPKENDRRSHRSDPIIETVALRKKIFLSFAGEFGISEKKMSESHGSFTVSSSRPRSQSWSGYYDAKGGCNHVIYKSPAILRDLTRRFLDSYKQQENKWCRKTSLVDEPFLRSTILKALTKKYENTQKLLDDAWKVMEDRRNVFIESGLRTSILIAMSEMSDEDLGRRNRRNSIVSNNYMPCKWRRRSSSWHSGCSTGKFRRRVMTDDPVILYEMLQRSLIDSENFSQELYKTVENMESEDTNIHSSSVPIGSYAWSEEYEYGESTSTLCDEPNFMEHNDTDFRRRILEEISPTSEDLEIEERKLVNDVDLRTSLLLSLSKMSEEVYGRKSRSSAYIDPVLRARFLISLSQRDIFARGYSKDVIFNDPDLRKKVLELVTETSEKDLVRKEQMDFIIGDPILRLKFLKSLSSEGEKHDRSNISDHLQSSELSDQQTSTSRINSMKMDHESRLITDTIPAIARRSTSWPGFDYEGQRKRGYSLLGPLNSASVISVPFSGTIKGKKRIKFTDPSECCAQMSSEEEEINNFSSASLMGDNKSFIMRRRALSWPGDCSKRGRGKYTIPDFRTIRNWMIQVLRYGSTERCHEEVNLIDALLKMGAMQSVLRSLDDDYEPTIFKVNIERKISTPTEPEKARSDTIFDTISRRTLQSEVDLREFRQEMVMINDNVMPTILHHLTLNKLIDPTSPSTMGVIMEERETKKLMLQKWSPRDTLEDLRDTVVEGSTDSSQTYIARRMSVVLGTAISEILPKMTSGTFEDKDFKQLKAFDDFLEKRPRLLRMKQLLWLPRSGNREPNLSDMVTETKSTVVSELPHIFKKMKQSFREVDMPCLALDIANMEEEHQLRILKEVLDKSWRDALEKFWRIGMLSGTEEVRDLATHYVTGLQNTLINTQMEASPDEDEFQQEPENFISKRISYDSDPKKVLTIWRRKSRYVSPLGDKDESASTGMRPKKVISKRIEYLLSHRESVTGPTVEEVRHVPNADENDPELKINSSDETVSSYSDEVVTKKSKHSSSSSLEYLLGTTCYDADSEESVSALIKTPRLREPIRRPGIIGIEDICLYEKVKYWLDSCINLFIDSSELHSYMKPERDLQGDVDPNLDKRHLTEIVDSTRGEIPSINAVTIHELLPKRKSIPSKRIRFADEIFGFFRTPSPTSFYDTNSTNSFDNETLNAVISHFPETPIKYKARKFVSSSDKKRQRTPSLSGDISPDRQYKTSGTEEHIVKRKLGFNYDSDPYVKYIPTRERVLNPEVIGNMSLYHGKLRKPTTKLYRFADHELNVIHRRMTGVISEFTGEVQRAVDRKTMEKLLTPIHRIPAPDITPEQMLEVLLHIQKDLDEIEDTEKKKNLRPKQRKAMHFHLRRVQGKYRTVAIEDVNYGVFGGAHIIRWVNFSVILDFLRRGYFGGFPEVDPEVFNMQTMEQKAIIAYVTGRAGCVLPQNLPRIMGDRVWMGVDEFWSRNQVRFGDNYFPGSSKRILERKDSFPLARCLGPAGVCSLVGVGKLTRMNQLEDVTSMPTFLPYEAGGVRGKISIFKHIDTAQHSASVWLMTNKYKAFIEDQTFRSHVRLNEMIRLVGEVMLMRLWDYTAIDDVRVPLHAYDVNNYFRDFDEEWVIGRLSVFNTLLEDDYFDQFATSKLIFDMFPDFLESKVPLTIQDSSPNAKVIVATITEPLESLSYVRQFPRAFAIFRQIKLQHQCMPLVNEDIMSCKSLLKSLKIAIVELDLKKVPDNKKWGAEPSEHPIKLPRSVEITEDVITPWANIGLDECKLKQLRVILRERRINRIFQPTHSYLITKKATHSRGQRRIVLLRQMINENFTIMDTITNLIEYYNAVFPHIHVQKITSGFQNHIHAMILARLLEKLHDFGVSDSQREGFRKVTEILRPESIAVNPMLRRMFRPNIYEEWDLSHFNTLSFYLDDEAKLLWTKRYHQLHKERIMKTNKSLEETRIFQEGFHNDMFREVLETLIRQLIGPLGTKEAEEYMMNEIPAPSFLALDGPWGMKELETFNEYRRNVTQQVADRSEYISRHVDLCRCVLAVMDMFSDRFDKRLFDFWKLKNEVHCSIAGETMRMARYTQFVAETFREASSIMDMIKQLEELEKALPGLKETISELQCTVSECYTLYETSLNEATHMDHIFKEKSKKLKPKAVIIFMKSYLKKPTSMIKVLKLESDLIMTNDSFEEEELSYISKECLDFFQELKYLNQYENAPQDVSPEHWDQICQARYFRVMSQVKIRVTALEFAEAVGALNYYKSLFKQHLEKMDELLSSIHKRTDKWIKRFTDFPIQLTVKHPKNLLSGLTLDTKDIEDIFCLSEKEIAKYKARDKTAMQIWQKTHAASNLMRIRLEAAVARQEMVRLRIEDFNINEKFLMTKLQFPRFTTVVKNLVQGEPLPWYKPTFTATPSSFRVTIMRRIQRTLATRNRYKFRLEKLRKINALMCKEIDNLRIEASQANKQLKDHPDYWRAESTRVEHEKSMVILFQLSQLKKIYAENIVEIKKLQLELELMRMKKYPALAYDFPLTRKDEWS